MSRVITFSRTFPAYHPKAGQPTYFVEKVVRSLHEMGVRPFDVNCDFNEEMYYLCDAKNHTIRAGKRWKVGDKFSPRVWSGRPYNSKQIQFAPDIEVAKTWEFEMKVVRYDGALSLFGFLNDKLIESPQAHEIAKNDGLSSSDFDEWFRPKQFIVNLPTFSGQIICWNESINY